MAATSIEEEQAQIVEEFQSIDDWQDRYREIIKIGRQLPDFPEEHRVDANLVKGCQNRVWLHARLDDEGRVQYVADSEAMIVRGLVALLLRVYSGRDPDTIITTPPDFVSELDLGSHLSQSRANGLASMVKQMKLYALAFKTMLDQRAGTTS